MTLVINRFSPSQRLSVPVTHVTSKTCAVSSRAAYPVSLSSGTSPTASGGFSGTWRSPCDTQSVWLRTHRLCGAQACLGLALQRFLFCHVDRTWCHGGGLISTACDSTDPKDNAGKTPGANISVSTYSQSPCSSSDSLFVLFLWHKDKRQLHYYEKSFISLCCGPVLQIHPVSESVTNFSAFRNQPEVGHPGQSRRST